MFEQKLCALEDSRARLRIFATDNQATDGEPGCVREAASPRAIPEHMRTRE